MRNMVKRTAAGAVVGGSLLVTGGLGIASAAPVNNVGDQLVNLSVGNANILHDVNVDVAAQIAGLLCGTGTSENGTAPNGAAPAGMTANGPAASEMATNETTANAGDIAAQARQVDAGQIPTTSCDSPQGVVTISQNGPANSPEAPGQQRGSATTSTAPAPAPAGALGPAPTG